MYLIYFPIKKSAGKRGCFSMTQRSKISNTEQNSTRYNNTITMRINRLAVNALYDTELNTLQVPVGHRLYWSKSNSLQGNLFITAHCQK